MTAADVLQRLDDRGLNQSPARCLASPSHGVATGKPIHVGPGVERRTGLALEPYCHSALVLRGLLPAFRHRPWIEWLPLTKGCANHIASGRYDCHRTPRPSGRRSRCRSKVRCVRYMRAATHRRCTTVSRSGDTPHECFQRLEGGEVRRELAHEGRLAELAHPARIVVALIIAGRKRLTAQGS
jgi:hypothetical protein